MLERGLGNLILSCDMFPPCIGDLLGTGWTSCTANRGSPSSSQKDISKAVILSMWYLSSAPGGLR